MTHFKPGPTSKVALLLFGLSTSLCAQTGLPDAESFLPPARPWSAKSQQLVVAPDDPWITPSESSGLRRTPRYVETVAWLNKLVQAAPELEMVSLGKSLEGRDFWMVIASSDGAFTPQEMIKTGKPTLLAQAGIHAGEIDGKDAGLMLLRDMTLRGTQKRLLDQANFLFVPILNVDGHERFSPYNRINQRGPQAMGWRTNARNLNLNRDYTKLDTQGIRAVLAAINAWQPDLYMDLHVTDGADYQYDITFGANGAGGWSPAIGAWLDEVLTPEITKALEDWGHIPGPLAWPVNGRDFADGNATWTAGPRYSNGYGDLRHLPTILVENHSLKPYDQRVLGTYLLLASTLKVLGEQHASLRQAVAVDRAARPEEVPLGWQEPEDGDPGDFPLKGVRSERYLGPVSGAVQVRWTGEVEETRVPNVRLSEPRATVRRPRAYLIPPAWVDIAERVALHGIRVSRLEEPVTALVEVYRLPEADIAPSAPYTPSLFEGRVRVDPGTLITETARRTFPAGSYRVDTDQPLGDLAVLLLEPGSADSFFQWGLFLEIFNRTEYADAYVMEPLAQRMMEQDPALLEAFQQRLLNDPDFAADPGQRLQWFYEKTPYFDQNYRVYPVARLMEPAAGDGPGSLMEVQPGEGRAWRRLWEK